MLRSKLRNQFLKEGLETRIKYNKTRNICVSLGKKANQNYYRNLDLKEINRNKKFWATEKPLFSNKMKVSRKHFLDESGEIIRNGFNRYFVNMAPSMGVLTETFWATQTSLMIL